MKFVYWLLGVERSRFQRWLIICAVLVALVLVAPFLWVLTLHTVHLVTDALTTEPTDYLQDLAKTEDDKLFGNVRNLGLVVLGVLGTGLALWRSALAHQAHKLSEKGLIIDRYQKGAQMLESGEQSVRIAGVYALRELALSDPEEAYFLVLDILFTFVREKSKGRKALIKLSKETATNIEYEELAVDLHAALAATSQVRGQPSASSFEAQRDWKANVRGANLSGAEFRDANLSGASLQDANLSGASLQDANLSGASLQDANLSGAIFQDADLSGASLQDANLSGAIFQDADLSGASLQDANLSGASLQDANLSGADLQDTNLAGAELAFAKMSGAKLLDANLAGAMLNDANLSGANLKAANLAGARLQSANLSGADIQFADLSKSGLQFANLSGADLQAANLSGAVLRNANLSGAELSGTNLSGADLQDANLSGAVLWNADLSGAGLSGILVDNTTDLEGIWAFETDPPVRMSEREKAAIFYRKNDENWTTFVDRRRQE